MIAKLFYIYISYIIWRTNTQSGEQTRTLSTTLFSSSIMSTSRSSGRSGRSGAGKIRTTTSPTTSRFFGRRGDTRPKDGGDQATSRDGRRLILFVPGKDNIGGWLTREEYDRRVLALRAHRKLERMRKDREFRERQKRREEKRKFDAAMRKYVRQHLPPPHGFQWAMTSQKDRSKMRAQHEIAFRALSKEEQVQFF